MSCFYHFLKWPLNVIFFPRNALNIVSKDQADLHGVIALSFSALDSDTTGPRTGRPLAPGGPATIYTIGVIPDRYTLPAETPLTKE